MHFLKFCSLWGGLIFGQEVRCPRVTRGSSAVGSRGSSCVIQENPRFAMFLFWRRWVCLAFPLHILSETGKNRGENNIMLPFRHVARRPLLDKRTGHARARGQVDVFLSISFYPFSRLSIPRLKEHHASSAFACKLQVVYALLSLRVTLSSPLWCCSKLKKGTYLRCRHVMAS